MVGSSIGHPSQNCTDPYLRHQACRWLLLVNFIGKTVCGTEHAIRTVPKRRTRAVLRCSRYKSVSLIRRRMNLREFSTFEPRKPFAYGRHCESDDVYHLNHEEKRGADSTVFAPQFKRSKYYHCLRISRANVPQTPTQTVELIFPFGDSPVRITSVVSRRLLG